MGSRTTAPNREFRKRLAPKNKERKTTITIRRGSRSTITTSKVRSIVMEDPGINDSKLICNTSRCKNISLKAGLVGIV